MDSTNQGAVGLDDVKNKAEEDIFAAMGAADIPEDEKGALLARMMDLIQSRALLKIVDRLNDSEKTELEAMLDNEETDPEKIDNFLVEKATDYQQIFLDEAKRLRQELTIEFAE